MTKRKYQQKKSKKKNKRRKSLNSGSSGDKRQRLPSNDSDSYESTMSEAFPEIFAGETKESGSDRRGREKKEREQKKREGIAKRQRQRIAKMAAYHIKPITANIGGNRVKKNGIIEFEGGTDYQFESSQEAKDVTGISKNAIRSNIFKKNKSRGIKGVFEGQKVMFINTPVDTSDKVPCPVTGCNRHFSRTDGMTAHVRNSHPEVPLPPVRELIRMPEEYRRFTPPITPEQYAFILQKIRKNIQYDIDKSDLKPKLMAMIDGYEPWGSTNIKRAARKYHLDEQQILDSIANHEQLTIVGGTHELQLGPGTSTRIILAGRKVTFSLKHHVSEEDKIKLTKMNNKETRLETYHMIARQYCEHMNAGGMFAKKNVTDDNGGLIKNGFEFEKHGGLFAISFDRIEDVHTVNGQTFHKLHYPDPENALENIRTVALMANVRYKATTAKIQERYDIYKNKSVEQRKEEFKKVLEFSQKVSISEKKVSISEKASHNRKKTPLYAHAYNTWEKDDECKVAFPNTRTEKGFKTYWQHMLVLLKKQEGLCKVAKTPMSLESGPWLMSCDAIDPLLGHVPGNLRLVCLYNNVTDHSKLNKDLTDTTPHRLNTDLHDEYWRIVR